MLGWPVKDCSPPAFQDYATRTNLELLPFFRIAVKQIEVTHTALLLVFYVLDPSPAVHRHVRSGREEKLVGAFLRRGTVQDDVPLGYLRDGVGVSGQF